MRKPNGACDKIPSYHNERDFPRLVCLTLSIGHQLTIDLYYGLYSEEIASNAIQDINPDKSEKTDG